MRDYAHGKRTRLHTLNVEDEHYGKRQYFSRKERQTLSPTQKIVQAKVVSIEDTSHAVRMVPEVEAKTRLRRVQVKVEAPTESALRRDRKRKQVSREAELERREMGCKPHFLSVDDKGRPYGLGAKSWRA
jgi:hypothetical protein